jgi:hypothetical protein
MQSYGWLIPAWIIIAPAVFFVIASAMTGRSSRP